MPTRAPATCGSDADETTYSGRSVQAGGRRGSISARGRADRAGREGRCGPVRGVAPCVCRGAREGCPQSSKFPVSGCYSGIMNSLLRVPSTLATRKGTGFLAEKAAKETVVLTNHGKPTAVVMSPENYDEMQRSLRAAADRIISGVADVVAEGTTFRSVDEARRRLHAEG